MHRPMQKKYADQPAHGLSDWQRAGEDDLSTRFVILLENLHELEAITNKKTYDILLLIKGDPFFAGASHASLRIFSFCCCYALFSL